MISKFFQLVTGKTEAELSAAWQWNYFVTRSSAKAYWLTLRGRP